MLACDSQIAQALTYDAAASEEFAGFVAFAPQLRRRSRLQCERPRCSGVLEQSWRVGGASGAEIAALEAFRAEPALQVVRASTVEVYGRTMRLRSTLRFISAVTTLMSGGSPSMLWSSPCLHGIRQSRLPWTTGTSPGPWSCRHLQCPEYCSCTAGAAARSSIWRGRARSPPWVRLPHVRPARPRPRPSVQYERVSREDNLHDVLAAYDLLRGQPAVDDQAIAVVGSSYGGYLAAILTSRRRVRWLGLRAPALYWDEDSGDP